MKISLILTDIILIVGLLLTLLFTLFNRIDTPCSVVIERLKWIGFSTCIFVIYFITRIAVSQ